MTAIKEMMDWIDERVEDKRKEMIDEKDPRGISYINGFTTALDMVKSEFQELAKKDLEGNLMEFTLGLEYKKDLEEVSGDGKDG